MNSSYNGCYSGGGGAYGTDGDDGDRGSSGGLNSYIPYGGNDYGSATITAWSMGSGGGGGGGDNGSDGRGSDEIAGEGGEGGGLIALYSATSITHQRLPSRPTADRGDDRTDGRWVRRGAGGQILLAALTATVNGEVEALGGDGGSGRRRRVDSGGAGATPQPGALHQWLGQTDPTAARVLHRLSLGRRHRPWRLDRATPRITMYAVVHERRLRHRRAVHRRRHGLRHARRGRRRPPAPRPLPSWPSAWPHGLPGLEGGGGGRRPA